MRKALVLVLLALAAFALVATPPRIAQAAGTVQVSTREPVEDDGKWKLKFTIDNGTPPVLPHMPMLFVFTPTVLYERALTDKTGDKPILNRIPLQNQQAINESMDVGFSDGTGKIFKKTQFDFVIRRDRGFEAGEYDLKIKREGDGVQIGPTIKLSLKGDNPIVDRRAIVFSGDKKKKVEADKPAGGGTSEPKKEDAPAPAGDEPKPEAGEAPPSEPPPVPPKQGGCGCRTAGDEQSPIGTALALGFVAVAIARRRRRIHA